MVTFCSSLFFCAAFAWQREPIVTDRPDFTESAIVVPRGAIQLEGGFTYEWTNRTDRTFALPELLARVWIAENVEARIGFPTYLRTEAGGVRTEGFADLNLGAKLQLGNGRDGWDFALIPSVTLPTGADALRTAEAIPEVAFAWSKDLPNDHGVGGMIAVALPRNGGARQAEWEHALVLSLPVSDRTGGFVEHVVAFGAGQQPAHLAHFGLAYQPNPDSQWDFHAGFGLNRQAPRFFVAGGYSVRF